MVERSGELRVGDLKGSAEVKSGLPLTREPRPVKDVDANPASWDNLLVDYCENVARPYLAFPENYRSVYPTSCTFGSATKNWDADTVSHTPANILLLI
jgi:hypothetical protein